MAAWEQSELVPYPTRHFNTNCPTLQLPHGRDLLPIMPYPLLPPSILHLLRQSD